MSRRLVRTPKQSLKEILESQLDKLAALSSQRLLDAKETRLLQVLSPLTGMDLKDEDTVEDLPLSADERRAIEEIARGKH